MHPWTFLSVRLTLEMMQASGWERNIYKKTEHPIPFTDSGILIDQPTLKFDCLILLSHTNFHNSIAVKLDQLSIKLKKKERKKLDPTNHVSLFSISFMIWMANMIATLWLPAGFCECFLSSHSLFACPSVRVCVLYTFEYLITFAF